MDLEQQHLPRTGVEVEGGAQKDLTLTIVAEAVHRHRRGCGVAKSPPSRDGEEAR